MAVTNQPKIYVAGHRRMVGSAIVRALEKEGQTNIVVRTSAELDLTNQQAVRDFLGSSCIYPKAVTKPMQEDALLTGVLEATDEPYAIAKIAGIKQWESYNRQYGVDYRSVMPTNLYDVGDNYLFRK
jgi:GDP-L-fucose synthase